MPIDYRLGNDVPIDAFAEVLAACALGARRPLDDPERLRAMLRHANLVVSAWEGPLLVGIARSLSDFSFATYLSDLAVRESHQRLGIGRELVRRTREAGGRARIVLLAAPSAKDYYGRIGFAFEPRAWSLDGLDATATPGSAPAAPPSP